jgi:lipid A 3-O-deacylase
MTRRVSPIIAVLSGAPATAQSTITLMHDNDEWANTEQEYASGSRLAVVNAEWGKTPLARAVAAWLPGAEPGNTLAAGFGAGHYFCIPRDIGTAAPSPGQRPYAGWLHGSGLIIRANASRQDTWELETGVVGPSALGEPLQEFFHGIFNAATCSAGTAR